MARCRLYLTVLGWELNSLAISLIGLPSASYCLAHTHAASQKCFYRNAFYHEGIVRPNVTFEQRDCQALASISAPCDR